MTAQAVRLIPAAGIGLAPHDTTLINIQTVMWVDTEDTQTLPVVTILGQQVHISITLDSVTWTFGDGATANPTTPGAAYDETHHPCTTRLCPGYFGHIYTRTGSVTVHATAHWHAAFTVGTGPTVQIPGTIDGPTAAGTLTVKEARAVLVPSPGER